MTPGPPPATLQTRWDALCARVGAFKSAEEAGLTFDLLERLYAHPPRAYHNLDHIAQVLDVFDSVRTLAEDRDCVEFALWMHDCVYFAERPDNEERSADAATMIAGLLGCSRDFAAKSRSLIAVTRHSIEPPRGDWALMADVDLSILGAPRDEYDAYRKAVRQDFSFASDEDWITGRTAFLQRMVDRDRIYFTAYFAKAFDAQSRSNMYWEIDELAAGRL